MTDEFLRKMDPMYMIIGIMIVGMSIIILVAIFEFSNSFTIEELEALTCPELMKLIKNSDYGVEYHDKWIEKECWK